jgi:alpha-ribazole phosphatase
MFKGGTDLKSYVIHLIRHGITEGNSEGRYIGSTDLPLSAEGEKQLRSLAAKYPYPKAEAYFVSPLERCKQTVKILYPDAKPTVINDFRECDFGAWENKTAKEISAQNPDFARWVAGEGKGITPPGGESGGAVVQRVCAAFERIVQGLMAAGTTSAVIVAHGGTIMSILSVYGLPRAQFYDWMTESGCGYSMRITPGLWMRSMVGEVYARIPAKADGKEPGAAMVDAARKAANMAFGQKGHDNNGGKKENQ